MTWEPTTLNGLPNEHGPRQDLAQVSSRGTSLGIGGPFGQKYQSIKDRDCWPTVICGRKMMISHCGNPQRPKSILSCD